MTSSTGPPGHIVDGAIRAALAEDLGAGGDITSQAVIDRDVYLDANIVARRPGVVAGLTISLTAFEIVDSSVIVIAEEADGSRVAAQAILASVSGPARAVLAAERTCLNMLGHLSGISTATRHVVDQVSHTRATIIDTRKTTPGLRALEKYAVRAGGGGNHRFGLFDAILIKDNHLEAAGGIEAAITAARASAGHAVKIEVEVDDIAALDAAIAAGADAVLLDNMSPQQLADAVERNMGRVVLEASGGITPETVVAVAEAGIDLISLGWLTHSAPHWDVALDVVRSYRRS